ncbi:polyphenol oxidase, chloroplastic-like [Rutidosis leptorrhynchoides]|uniref:polyphenol oxidase, chloroplastic-like n=1 Tax=Rutidosis leptorrhynchoides TaxID=125765 RepID=UPI003A98FAEA
MSSFTLLLSTLPISHTKNTNTSFSPSLLFSKTSSHNQFKISCNATSSAAADDDKQPKTSQSHETNQHNNVDRRNVLLGLGGLYGASNFTSIPSAFAVPIQAPDNITHCVKAHTGVYTPEAVKGVSCCPPVLKPDIAPAIYQLPPRPTKLRVRPTAHEAANDQKYLEKFRLAVKLMKRLPDDDPRSWINQGKIHCAYCNAGYTQEKSGYDTVNLQVHNSALFFPFHRWYLYFFERILGSLIGDESFAIPYWNWDNKDGMTGFPTMYEEPMPPPPDKDLRPTPKPQYNPLFDGYRDATHVTATINFQREFIGSDDEIKNNNLALGKKRVRRDPLKEGPIPGSMYEDMGNFYSAGYDPLFYCHHANVDRMWHLWETVLHDDHPDPACEFASDWENSSYVFYDENKNLVRVFNKDCVDIEEMGYKYKDSDIKPWLNYESTPHAAESNIAAKSIGKVKKAEEVQFPIKLEETVKLLVKRPALNRTHEEKLKTREMLFLNGIEYDSNTSFKFDVLINDVDDGTQINASNSEFVGCFEQLQHGVGGSMKMTTGARFGITGIMEELKAEGDEYVLVSLVPKYGCENVTIGGVKIDLVNIRR